jgi:hypothetical protein
MFEEEKQRQFIEKYIKEFAPTFTLILTAIDYEKDDVCHDVRCNFYYNELMLCR